jgi:hypothetical protein
MNTMIKTSTGWNISKMLMVAVFALTLTACGGGSSGTASTVSQINSLIASGTATDLEAAMELLLNNQDNLAAADFEALMDAIAAA